MEASDFPMLIAASAEAKKQQRASGINIKTIGIAIAIPTQYATFTTAEPKDLHIFLNLCTLSPLSNLTDCLFSKL